MNITAFDFGNTRLKMGTISNGSIENLSFCTYLDDYKDLCLKYIHDNKSEKVLVSVVNKKNYELCYGITKKLLIKENNQKTFLINLAELMNIPNDAERPYVKILSR